MKNFLSALQTPSELRIEKSGEKIPGRKIKLFRPDYKFIRPEGDSEIAVEKLNIYIKDQHILKDINVRIPDKKNHLHHRSFRMREINLIEDF